MASSLYAFDDAVKKRFGARYLIGVDEAGRGCLAGPVVAAAVILQEPGRKPPLDGLRDSKLLPPLKRELLFEALRSRALCRGVAAVSAGKVDALNILQATLVAMRRAIMACLKASPVPLPLETTLALVDGNRPVPGLERRQQTWVDADALSASVAAASIVAKVTRDRWMREQDALYPGYGFKAHKGYGTAVHLEALRSLGPCEIHRRTFKPVRQLSDVQ
ncbi:MAG: ribonuclease HII [Elusimicrobia bacterium RIFCSPLOWO2_12_FULL_59_9]|nr:MAG: ribonuclease HII [Elusimicrobia bacterium RIFCSPLOWO2_12_FULL_59_9]